MRTPFCGRPGCHPPFWPLVPISATGPLRVFDYPITGYHPYLKRQDLISEREIDGNEPGARDAKTGRMLPRYRSHKIVSALEIAHIEGGANGAPASILFANPAFTPLAVDGEMFRRYFPQPGDYYVVYEDGYASISPQAAFKGGYTEIAPTADKPDRMLKLFAYEHLRADLLAVSRPFSDLAHLLVLSVPAGPERTVALRKLIEAKDAAVRAVAIPEGD